MGRRRRIKDRLRALARRARGSGTRAPEGPRLVAAFAASHPDATFVEIGANDGEQHDFLRPVILRGHWSGVMVEPVPYVFERLRANYRGMDGVRLEQAAIGDSGAPQPFYYLRDSSPDERAELPEWYDGIGSFDRQNILDHARHIPDVGERLVTAEVPVLSFDELCDKHGLGSVDVVVIDTEGYDWEVLRRIDLDRWRPRLIVFEHYHLDPQTEAAALELLEGAGYLLFREGFDTFALHPDEPVDLRARFRRAKPAAPALARSREAV